MAFGEYGGWVCEQPFWGGLAITAMAMLAVFFLNCAILLGSKYTSKTECVVVSAVCREAR